MSDPLMYLEPFRRPNGKPYHPRKAPVVQEVRDLDGDFAGIVVLRALSVERARQLAAPLLAEYEIDPERVQLHWWRDAMRNGEREWVDDPVRGMPAWLWEWH